MIQDDFKNIIAEIKAIAATKANNYEWPKILLSCPISKHKNYIAAEWFTYIRTLSYPGLDFYFVDNSQDPNYHKYIQKLGFNCDYVAPNGRKSNVFMAECNELIRKKAIEENYDYLFLHEIDQFASKNIIESLLRHQKLVTSAVYHIGTCYSRHYYLVQNYKTIFNQIRPINIAPIGTLLQRGKLVESRANGNGCILIHKSILEKIKFHVDGPAHADTYFFEDLHQLNIKTYADLKEQIYHYNQSWGTIPEHRKLNLTKN